MNIELKPCPFCGATPATNCFGSEGVFPEMACVICINEECASRPEVWGETEEAAAEAWNTRAERTCKPANVAEYAWDDFECSECGWVTWNFLMEHSEGCGTVCQPRYCPNCGAKVVEE